MAKQESEFLTIMKKSLIESGAFFFKIKDMPHFAGAKFRFDSDKPFDAIAVYKGIPIAIEAKSLSEFRAFGMRDIRESQVRGLSEWQAAGGVSLVVVQVKIPRTENRMICLEWTSFLSRWREDSIKKVELAGLPHVKAEKVLRFPSKSVAVAGLEPVKEIRYDMRALLEGAEAAYLKA